MKYLPVFIAALLATVVTFALFLFMHKLISSSGGDRVDPVAIAGIHFGPSDLPDEITSRSRRKPSKPPPPKDRPPVPKMPVSRGQEQVREMPVINLPKLDMPLFGGEGMFLGNFRQVDQAAGGDIIPIVVIRPVYPNNAANSGIEGWVKIEFTITASGTVMNPRVVDARPAGVFNRAAIRAILKWKFKPRVIDGVAVERQASQVIDFTLDDSLK